jgi:hypothetical protein
MCLKYPLEIRLTEQHGLLIYCFEFRVKNLIEVIELVNDMHLYNTYNMHGNEQINCIIMFIHYPVGNIFYIKKDKLCINILY